MMQIISVIFKDSCGKITLIIKFVNSGQIFFYYDKLIFYLFIYPCKKKKRKLYKILYIDIYIQYIYSKNKITRIL